MKRILIILFLLTSLFLSSYDKILDDFTPNNYNIFSHTEYLLSYNNEYHVPNWVIYKCDKSYLVENASRVGISFKPDPLIEYSITADNFKGYDIGHMTPADHMTFNLVALKETFYTSNACPQTAALNRGEWKKIESLTKVLAESGLKLIVICGPIIGNKQFIGKDKIIVPDMFFKIIIDYEHKKLVCFALKNNDNYEGNNDIHKYIVELDYIESLTGLRLDYLKKYNKLKF